MIAAWDILDPATGERLATHERYQKRDGRKAFRWKWHGDARPMPAMPLYRATLTGTNGAHGLAILCEGEKSADAVAARGTPAFGTVCGAAVTPGDDSLAPLLDFARVVLWADADEPGRAHMARIAARLAALGHGDIRMLEHGDEKHDAADFAGDAQAFANVLETARPHDLEIADGGEWPEPDALGNTDADLPPFPLDALTERLRRTVDEISRFSKVAPEGPAVAVLAAIAGVAGKGILIEEKPGLCHHPALFFLAIADPSERKSALLRPVRDILRGRVIASREAHEARHADAILRNEIRGRQLDAIRKTAKRDADPDELARQAAELRNAMETVPPALPLPVDDCTSQFLVRYMAAHGEEAFVLSPEGRNTLDQVLGRYTKGDFTDESVYLHGISGDPIGRGRVGNDPARPFEHVDLARPCLNVCVFVQPDKWRALLENGAMRDSGLVSRIAIVRMPRMAGTRFERAAELPLDDRALEGFRAAVDHIVRARELFDEPTTLTLSTDAAEARRSFHNEIESEIAGAFADHADTAGKAVTQAVKLAGVLHLADMDSGTAGNAITLETWQRAESLGRYFLTAAIAAARAGQESPTTAAARRILDRAHDMPDPFTARDVLRRGLSGLTDKGAVSEALEALADCGWIRPTLDRGRPTKRYQWHPAARADRKETAA